MARTFDIAVVGAGLVGLAAARAVLERRPGTGVVVLEKEESVARHQSGRNSGVLHAGVSYRPGSRKARLCVEGRRRLVAYCRRRRIPHEICGKLVVASDADEVDRLDRLAEQAAANGVETERLTTDRIARREPDLGAREALLVPGCGVVDFRLVAERLADDVDRLGGEVRCGWEVQGMDPVDGASGGSDGRWRVRGVAGEVVARRLLNCAGLHGDRLARMAGADPPVRIVPFRGEYYRLGGRSSELVRHLVYPVPDPDLPFLGVHAHRTIDDEVHVGPNAVLAGAREGYRWRDISAAHLADVLAFAGFWRLALRHPVIGLHELARSLSRHLFAASVRRLVPAVRTDDLEPIPSGVRAQAVAPDGSLVEDFCLLEGDHRSLHVLNAPSPAATACLAIGEEIAERLLGAG